MQSSAELSRRVDVAIVGAGYAGLAAADALRAAGASVLVLEARDRVGGRTYTREIGGGMFDVGGQWLGAGQRRLAALTARFGVATYPTFHTGLKLLDDGDTVSRYAGTIPKLRALELVELALTLRRIDRMSRAASPRDPLSARNARELDARSIGDEMRRIRSQRVRRVLATALGTIFGATPAEMSLLYFLTYLRAGGGLMNLCEIEGGAQERRLVGGTGGLATTWARELGIVETSAPVRSIRHADDDVILDTPRGSIAARRAIVTVPPPLVASIEIDRASPRRSRLIAGAKMGALVKLIVVYDRPFWRHRGLSGEAVALAPSPVATTFDNCLPNGPAALVCFVQADQARQPIRDSAVLAQLARWFGEEARRPTTMAAMDWCAEPYSRGCPTAVVAPGALSDAATTLREPVARVHFAGAETAIEWTGYIEGALESGERAAREVLRAL